MALIGAINCTTNVGNTGNPLCYFDPAFLSGAVMAPKGYQFDTTANTGNILTTLTAAFYATSKAARLYPLYDFEKPTDSSDKLTLQSMPNGAKHPVREGFNDWMFQYFDGGLTKHNNIRLFNGSNWDFYFIDTDLQTGLQRLLGIQGTTANMLQAYPCSPGGFFWAHPWGLNTGTERTRYDLQFQFNQRYTNTKGVTQFQSVPFTFDTALPGLNDAILFSPSANATPGSFNISVLSPLGVDLGAIYSAVLNVAALWTANNATSGAAITPVTSVTWVPGVPGINQGNGYFTLAIPTTAPPYPASGNVLFNLAAPTALVAAGAIIESTGPVSIVKS